MTTKPEDLDANLYPLLAEREVAALRARCTAAVAAIHAKAEADALDAVRSIAAEAKTPAAE